MRVQPWFEGRFATYGGSYLGFTQWSLLVDPPPELATAIVANGPHDFHAAVYRGGALSLSDYLSFSYDVAHQEDGGMIRKMIGMALAQRSLTKTMRSLPLDEACDRLLTGRAQWWKRWLTDRDPTAPVWRDTRLGESLDRVEVPILIQSGWQDLFIQQSLEQYGRLVERGVKVGLTVGPWTHGQAFTKGWPVILSDAFDWLDEHLGHDVNRERSAPVKVFVTGAERWRELGSWPPAATERIFYCKPGGVLGTSPSELGSKAEFTYDPADPTPSIGGSYMAPRASGYRDDSALARRGDTLVLDSSPLSSPLDVLGAPVVEIAQSSQNPNADLFVRLSEVSIEGGSRNVSDGFLRPDPSCSNGVIRLELDPIAHRFGMGSRIRLVIAGGAHPRWERNLGTDENPGTSSRILTSPRTIDLQSSNLALPVVISE
jgi:putative CocE/NonD family hydrolase